MKEGSGWSNREGVRNWIPSRDLRRGGGEHVLGEKGRRSEDPCRGSSSRKSARECPGCGTFIGKETIEGRRVRENRAVHGQEKYNLLIRGGEGGTRKREVGCRRRGGKKRGKIRD